MEGRGKLLEGAVQKAELAKDIAPAVRASLDVVVSRLLAELEQEDLTDRDLRRIHNEFRATMRFANQVSTLIKAGTAHRGDE